MSTDREDRWGDDEEPDRPAEADRAAVADRVRTPATLLIICGVLMLLLTFIGIGVNLSGYDVQVAILEWAEQQQPPGPQKEELKKEIAKAKARDRTPEYIQNAVFTVIGLGLDVVVLLGGIRMRQMRGYTLAVIGSVVAILPIQSCCCVTIPVGIWSLVVLMKPEVKAAFAATRRSLRDRDEFDR